MHLLQIMSSIPDRITGWLQPAAKTMLKFKQVRGTEGVLRFSTATIVCLPSTISLRIRVRSNGDCCVSIYANAS